MMEENGRVKRLLLRGVEEGVFSGAQAAWCRDFPDDPQWVFAGKTSRHAQAASVDQTTLFDVASLTKVFISTIALRLVHEGLLRLDATLEGYLAPLRGTRCGRATLMELLAHEAGFESWRPLYEVIPLADRGTEKGRLEILDEALRVFPGARSANAVYSDLGFMALMLILERVTGETLEYLVQDRLTVPLGLRSVHYRPLGGLSQGERTSIAATESCPWRGRELVGEVHDDNAWSMGGVSGHAGLFADACDLARLGGFWLRELKEGGYISRDLARRAIGRRPGGRGLGWDIKSPSGSAAGNRLGPRTFGHLGFTGCSLFVDPEREISVALCTNRVHLGRQNLSIRDFRPAFHDVVVDSL